jgi:hypothetical protein
MLYLSNLQLKKVTDVMCIFFTTLENMSYKHHLKVRTPAVTALGARACQRVTARQWHHASAGQYAWAVQISAASITDACEHRIHASHHARLRRWTV